MAGKRQRPDGNEDDVDLDEQLLNLLPDELQDSEEIYLEDEDEPPSTRGGMLAVVFGILFGLVVAGVAAWYLLAGPGSGPGGDDPLPQITADPGPFKERPQDPGGMTVENQDKLIYNRISDGATGPTGAEPDQETLLPDPEQPMAPPEPTSPAPRPASPIGESGTMPGAEADPEPGDESLSTGSPGRAEMAPDSEPDMAGRPTGPGVDGPESSAGIGTSAPVRLTPGGPEASAPRADMPSARPTPAPEPRATAPASPASPPAVPAVPAPRPPAGEQTAAATPITGPQIQIAALKSPDAAERAWETAKARHGDLLGSLRHQVIRADLGDKGVFYRLRVGPLASVNEAKALCAALKTRDQGCLVVP